MTWALPWLWMARIPRGRGGALVATIVVGTVIAGSAGLIPGTGTTPPPSPAGTDVVVATNGNDSTCVRGDQQFPCLTINRAYAIAQCGDEVEIRAGTYSGAISGNKSCTASWAISTNEDATCTTCVVMRPAENATVNLSSYNWDNVDFLILERGTGTDLNIGGGNWDGSLTNVIVRDADHTSGLYVNTGNNTTGYDNLAIVGGRWGDIFMDGGNIGIYFQTCVSPNCGSGVVGTDVLLDGITWDNFTTCYSCNPSDPPHTEVLRFDGGWQRFTIRNNTFTDIDANTATMFITNLEVGAADPANYTFVNNWWDDNAGNTFLQVHANVNSCGTFSLLYNTIADSPAGIECGSSSGMQWIGNVGFRESFATCQGTYSRNVWVDNIAGSQCGGSNTWVTGTWPASAGVGSDGNLTSTSVARAAGETAFCPGTDHQGEARPIPTATNCDAGWDERS